MQTEQTPIQQEVDRYLQFAQYTQNPQTLFNLAFEIRKLEDNIRVLKEEQKCTEYIIENMQFEHSIGIEGKNQQEREAGLRLKLSHNADYSLHRGSLQNCIKDAEKKKIELQYLYNLLSVHKILSRYNLIQQLSARGL